MALPPSLLDLAESLNTQLPLGVGEERIVRPGWVVWLGNGGGHPLFTVVQRFRLQESEVEAAVAEIRALLAARGRASSSWEIGPSATPKDLVTRLRALGLAPYSEPMATAMVLTRSLPPTESAIRARRAESVDDYVAAFEVLHRVFNERTETPAERRARAARELGLHRDGSGAIFLGTLDGKVVAAANAIYLDEAVVLGGGATLPEARGRGAYRALVAARYEDAVRRGTPTLVIQAGAMSRPILERLGFETVARIDILVNEVD